MELDTVRQTWGQNSDAKNFPAMTIPSRFKESALMSSRTAKYVEAMIREGDNFDYDKWLKRVRKEEAQAKQTEPTGSLGELPPAQIADPIKGSDRQDASSALPLTAKATLARALLRSHRQAKSQTPKVQLRRWLEKIRRVWEDFQASRARDAVYQYLDAVFAIVEHYRVRRRTAKLVRHPFNFANRPVDKSANPFSAVIRCTSGSGAGKKTISKWSRALRYVARCKPNVGLQTFMKEAGGVNACADRYAKHFGRGK